LFRPIFRAIAIAEAINPTTGRIIMLIKSTAGKDAGALRRVLGIMVGLMLAGAGLGLLGAIVFPELDTNRLPSSVADGRMPESARQLIRPRPLRTTSPTINVIAHCDSGRGMGALHDAHHPDGRRHIGAVGGRNLPLVQARCDSPVRGGTGRL
jgi:hypothetical protein